MWYYASCTDGDAVIVHAHVHRSAMHYKYRVRNLGGQGQGWGSLCASGLVFTKRYCKIETEQTLQGLT